jgi:hypothetical protein
MNRHVEVLQQRVQPVAFGRRRGEERRERVLVHHHQEQEKHLNGGVVRNIVSRKRMHRREKQERQERCESTRLNQIAGHGPKA